MAESLTARWTDELDSTLLVGGAEAAAQAKALEWLSREFPMWTIDVDVTSGWNGQQRDLWVADQAGHHPQRALSAAKLHTRLDEYQERERLRRSFSRP